MPDAPPLDELPSGIARDILKGFRRYRNRFGEITRDAKRRFEAADWVAAQEASAIRLETYKEHAGAVVQTIREGLRGAAFDDALWRDTKQAYQALIATEADFELAETFFNSINRDITEDGAADDRQMFVWSAFATPPVTPSEPITFRRALAGDLIANTSAILNAFDWQLPWRDLALDARNVLRSIVDARPEIETLDGLEVEVVRSVFYRNKGAYLVGRLVQGERSWPLMLALLIDQEGRLYVDALISDEDELSVLFSFTRSYFMVDAPYPHALIDYLHTLLPGKKRSELYSSVGFHKHGKTEFYRGFLTHLTDSDDEFIIAPGIKGMVMTVFTLPSYQTVFKIIKDRFAPQKNITREAVREKYYTVKTHDRVGRMADTQEFDNFAFPRSRFSNELIDELLAVAPSSILLTKDQVIIRHLYTERLMTPLNIYIETASDDDLREALDEYGNAIKQLAGANIFPGDMLLKNFGITRHGRVVFYDYDEICYLTEVNFRRLPEPRTPEEEMSAEIWFSVAANDVFPEEFRHFLFGRRRIKQLFDELHGELFEPEYWQALQRDIRNGLVMDVFPYRRSKRLRQTP
jgi:isocitrate dehydrogenase kinase/phosphatase